MLANFVRDIARLSIVLTTNTDTDSMDWHTFGHLGVCFWRCPHCPMSKSTDPTAQRPMDDLMSSASISKSSEFGFTRLEGSTPGLPFDDQSCLGLRCTQHQQSESNLIDWNCHCHCWIVIIKSIQLESKPLEIELRFDYPKSFPGKATANIMTRCL